MNIREILSLAPVVPVVTLSDLKHAEPLAKALVAGGLRVLEISMRSTSASACVEAIRKGVPEAIVGVGMLTRPADFAAAGRAGAQFGSAPGLTPDLAAAARGARFPLLPGVMTPSEIITARHSGFEVVQWFPAQALAAGVMRVLAASFPDVSFCPWGEISMAETKAFLGFANVLCVGGSWVAPQELVASGDWRGIEALAREAAALRSA